MNIRYNEQVPINSARDICFLGNVELHNLQTTIREARIFQLYVDNRIKKKTKQ